MFSSAEISVVLTLGSPNRLNRSSVTSRMRCAVRRGSLRVPRAPGRFASGSPSTGVSLPLRGGRAGALLMGWRAGRAGFRARESSTARRAAQPRLPVRGASRKQRLPTIAPAMSSIPAVSFQNVSKIYSSARGEVRALQGVGFDIPQGEFFGLLGPNGAGKTTLISILAGLSRASGGQVRVHGHDVVSDYALARRCLGIVPQELVFDPFFSVR